MDELFRALFALQLVALYHMMRNMYIFILNMQERLGDDAIEHPITVSMFSILALSVGCIKGWPYLIQLVRKVSGHARLILHGMMILYAYIIYWRENTASPPMRLFIGLLQMMHLLLFLVVVATSPGLVPKNLCLPRYNDDAIASMKRLECVERKQNGEFRYCKKTKCYKPDRAHYCPQMRQCILRMEMWSPMFSNAIGVRNVKFYNLYLFYTLVLNCCYLVAIHPAFQQQINLPDGFWGVLTSDTIVCWFGLVIVSLICLSLCFHRLVLSLQNLTNIEYFEKPYGGGYRRTFDKKAQDSFQEGEWTAFGYKVTDNPWNIGKFRNLQSIFGRNPLIWLFPINVAMEKECCGKPGEAGDWTSLPEGLFHQRKQIRIKVISDSL